jgi:hypothetical protein
MQKAYDLKDLAEKMKAAGLPEVEQMAEKAYGALKVWLKESAVLSEGKIDDVVVPFVDQLDALVQPQLDKIDGQEG